jgi:glycosyltransferase involved in cell wall biosynthesis
MTAQVSIIIPMYNESRYIARCLESLTHQSFQDFEVILIDDGSTDNTVQIAETFTDRFPLRILQQKRGGPGKARNR